jgi:hypothetical protein
MTTGVVVSPLDQDGEVGCSNCQRQANSGSMYRDFVPLTKKLVDYVQSGEKQPPYDDGMVLRSLEPSDVVPFLTRNLHWRVVGVSYSIEKPPYLSIYCICEGHTNVLRFFL